MSSSLKKTNVPVSEIDASISNAESSQSGEKEVSEEQLDSQISGSDNLWDSAGEMTSITTKLTRPKNFKTKAQLAQEKKLKDKLEKQRIREEILASTPVTDDETNLYSGYLADKSTKSLSEQEI